MSGYLVANSFRRSSDIKQYYFKRIIRIYPPYALCIVLTTIILFAFSKVNLHEYLPQAMRYIKNNLLFSPVYNLTSLFQNNPYPNAVNGSIWTMPVEMVCYLILPVCMLIGKAIKKYQISTVIQYMFFIVLFFVFRFKYPDTRAVVWGTDWVKLLILGSFFFGGVWISSLAAGDGRKFIRADLAVILIFMIIALGDYYHYELNVIFLPYIIIAFCISTSPLCPQFFNRWDIAYGLYLWAFPVQQVVILIANVNYGLRLDSILITLISFVITLCFALMQKLLIENPIGRLSARRR